MWVVISLAAGLLQTARNGLARSLSGVLPATLLSWSRFAFNLPFSFALILIVYSVDFDGPPDLPVRFLVLSLIAGIGQLLGNVALITSFRLATFAQAIVVHKTEVALAAITGFLFFSESPAALGWLGIFASALGVAMIGRASAAAKEPGVSVGWSDLVAANRGTGLALLAAAMLVVAGFGIQQATEALADANPDIDGTFGLAATTLFHVTWMEVVILTVWILVRERSAFRFVPQHLPRLSAIGFTSFAGSLGWFWAFSLSFVAFVKAVGQVESVASVLLAIYLWKE
ncbi:MAG: hypothetical protein AAGA65_17535, partial [Actinomycetota bacterium]